MISLYADEDFPLPVVVILRSVGVDVLASHEDGNAGIGIADAQVLIRATDLGRAILTQSRGLPKASSFRSVPHRNRDLHPRYGLGRPGRAYTRGDCSTAIPRG